MLLKMAKTTKPLTNTEVKSAKPKEKEYNLNDGDGLALRIKPNGTKIWLFNYFKPYSKKRTSISFGMYPTVTIKMARDKREEAKVLLNDKIDPKEQRDEDTRTKELAQSNSLEHIASSWLEVKKAKISKDHAIDTWRSLELHIFPSLGKTPIHKITAVNTIAVIKPLAAKGTLETVKRLCQRLNEIMVYAVNTGLIMNNPLSGIADAFQTPIKQHYPTIKPDELPALLKTISMASIKFTTRCLIEWQLHTMLRPSEAAGTLWSEIDLDNNLWNIQANRMKKKKAFIVPLTKQAIELLHTMKTISHNSEFVFPSDRNLKKPINSSTVNMALKRMGYGQKLVAHGFRSIASTAMNDEGFDVPVVEAALSHVGDNEVENAYNRSIYLERRKPLMQWWSTYIETAATGKTTISSFKGLTAIG